MNINAKLLSWWKAGRYQQGSDIWACLRAGMKTGVFSHSLDLQGKRTAAQQQRTSQLLKEDYPSTQQLSGVSLNILHFSTCNVLCLTWCHSGIAKQRNHTGLFTFTASRRVADILHTPDAEFCANNERMQPSAQHHDDRWGQIFTHAVENHVYFSLSGFISDYTFPDSLNCQNWLSCRMTCKIICIAWFNMGRLHTIKVTVPLNNL